MIRVGQHTLAELATTVARANVVLLIAAVDVTLIELTIPPMPDSKLRMALPNMVEDQLMGDLKDSVLQAGTARPGNHRTVAVAQRSWLQQLSTHLFGAGAHQVKALPDQLCLPWTKDQCGARLTVQGGQCSLQLRSNEEAGIGMLLESVQNIDDNLAMLDMLAPAGAIRLLVPGDQLQAYRTAISADPAGSARITVAEEDWGVTIQAARSVTINLMAGLNSADSNRVQWQLWKWPLVLATLVLLVNIGALNYDYWNLKREAQALKQGMLQTYRSTFPKETVVLFPLEQMRKHVDIAQRNAGQASQDDFTLLLSQFGAAWTSLNGAVLPKLVSIEFKDHGLQLQVKGDMPQKELQTALEEKGLELKKSNADIWQVRSVR